MIDTDFFRGLLEARKAELTSLQEASLESRATVALDQTSVGRLSRMDAMQAQAMAMAAQRRRQGELARIEAALRRLADGEYGHCSECGEEIARKRLEIDPVATACVRCASGDAR